MDTRALVEALLVAALVAGFIGWGRAFAARRNFLID